MAASDTDSTRDNRRREIAAARLLGIAGERIRADVLSAPTRQVSLTEMLAIATATSDEELHQLSQLLECPEEVLAMLRDGEGTALELDERALVLMAKRLGIARDTFMVGLLLDLDSPTPNGERAVGTDARVGGTGSRPDDLGVKRTPRWEVHGGRLSYYQLIWDEIEEWRPPKL